MRRQCSAGCEGSLSKVRGRGLSDTKVAFLPTLSRFHSQSPLGKLQSKSLTFLKATTVDRVTGTLGGMSSVGEVCSPNLQLALHTVPAIPMATSVPGQDLCSAFIPDAQGQDSDAP